MKPEHKDGTLGLGMGCEAAVSLETCPLCVRDALASALQESRFFAGRMELVAKCPAAGQIEKRVRELIAEAEALTWARPASTEGGRTQ